MLLLHKTQTLRKDIAMPWRSALKQGHLIQLRHLSLLGAQTPSDSEPCLHQALVIIEEGADLLEVAADGAKQNKKRTTTHHTRHTVQDMAKDRIRNTYAQGQGILERQNRTTDRLPR